MTKNDIFEKARKDLNMTEKQFQEVIKIIFDSILESLKNNEKVKIRNFGSFQVKLHKARSGRNPKTGDTISIPEKKAIKLCFAKNFKEELQKI